MIAVTDASGNAISDSSNIANVNPYRYRGYYYDTETGLYYLQSRYYNPEMGRFLNADNEDVLDVSNNVINDNNMFAYCTNNPINKVDDSGKFPLRVQRIRPNRIKITFTVKLRTIATYCAIKAAIYSIAAAVCYYIPGGQVGGLVCSILGITYGLVGGLIDKYGKNKKVTIWVQFDYSVTRVRKRHGFIKSYITMAHIRNVRVGGRIA